MSNILKSKSAKLVLGLVAFAFAFTSANVASAYTFTAPTLKMGSRSSQVMELQKALNMCADTMIATGAGSTGYETTYFGSKTAAVVKIWQAKMGLTADALFGPASRAKMNANGCGTTGGTTLPVGCTSTAGFSPVTGQACNGGTTIPQNGPVTAMLATNNPPANTVFAGQATADLAHFAFSGTGTVTGVQLMKSGASSNDILSNVYLYDGATRLTDSAAVVTGGMITFSNPTGLFMVNGSKVISVRADIKTAATGSQTVGVMLNNFSVAGQTSATSASIAGNLMTVASVSDLATAVVGTNTVIGSPTVDPGTSNYTIWSAPLSIGQRAVWFKGATFRIIGSAPADALANVRLLVDGSQVGTATTMALGGTISFDVSSAPVMLGTGTHTVEVRADVVGGANRSFYTSIQNAGDLMLEDGQYHVNVALSSGTVGTAFTMNNGVSIGINQGTLSLSSDPTFSTTRLTALASNQTIGKFQIRSFGEPVKVMQMTVTPTFSAVRYATVGSATATTAGSSTTFNATGSKTLVVSDATQFAVGDILTIEDGVIDAVGTITACTDTTPANSICDTGSALTINITTAGSTATLVDGSAISATHLASPQAGLQNVSLYLNGAQVGSSQNMTVAGALTFNLGSSLIVPAGTTIPLEVRADLTDASGHTYTSGSVQTAVSIPANQAQGTSSYALYPASPLSATSASALTFGTATATVAKSGYQDQSFASNSTDKKIGAFTISASSTEGIRVTNLAVAISGSLGTTNLSNLRVVASGATSTPVNPQASNNFSSDFTIAAGQSVTVDVLANIGNSTGTVIATLTVTGQGATSHTTVSGSATTGQTITVGTGTLGAGSVISTTTSAAHYVVGNKPGETPAMSGESIIRYNFTSTSAASTLTDLYFTTSGTAGAITSLTVTGGGGTCNGTVSGTTAHLTGCNIVVPAGFGGVDLVVTPTYNGVGYGGLTAGATATADLTDVEYTSGGIPSAVTAVTLATSNTMTLVATLPTIALNSPASITPLGNIQNKVGTVTISAGANGNVKLTSLPIRLTAAGGVSITGTAGSDIVIKEGSSTITTTDDIAASTTSGGDYTVTFSNNEIVTAGTSRTFDIYVSTTLATGADDTLTMSLAPASGFVWSDISGGAAGLTGTLMLNFPTTSVSISD